MDRPMTTSLRLRHRLAGLAGLACGVLAAGALAGCGHDRAASSSTSMPPPVADEVTYPVDEVTFAFDSDQLDAHGKAALDQIAAWVVATPERTIVVRGHASRVGPADYNLDLSGRRAETVSAYLTEHGVDHDRIIVAAVGEADAQDQPSGANRRVLVFSTLEARD